MQSRIQLVLGTGCRKFILHLFELLFANDLNVSVDEVIVILAENLIFLSQLLNEFSSGFLFFQFLVEKLHQFKIKSLLSIWTSIVKTGQFVDMD